MKQHRGKIIIFILVAAAATYFLLGKDRVLKYTAPIIDWGQKTLSIGIENAPKIVSTVSDKVSQGVSAATDKISEKTGEIFSEAILGIKTAAYNVLKDTIDEKMKNLEQDLGVKSSPIIGVSADGTSQEISPIFFYSAKVGVITYFTLQNLEGKDLIYEIDWGDGKIDNGELRQDISKTLFHKWDKAGNYTIKSKINTSKGEKEYNISIIVF